MSAKNPVQCTCIVCGTITIKPASQAGVFCGRDCYHIHQRRNNGFIDSKGYRRLTIDGKHIFEHRLVMEQLLGRKLLTTEVVHHINGERSDNRIENLSVFDNQSEHMTHHGRSWDVEEAASLRLSGLQLKQIADLLGVSINAIHYALRDRGLTKRRSVVAR